MQNDTVCDQCPANQCHFCAAGAMLHKVCRVPCKWMQDAELSAPKGKGEQRLCSVREQGLQAQVLPEHSKFIFRSLEQPLGLEQVLPWDCTVK